MYFKNDFKNVSINIMQALLSCHTSNPLFADFHLDNFIFSFVSSATLN